MALLECLEFDSSTRSTRRFIIIIFVWSFFDILAVSRSQKWHIVSTFYCDLCVENALETLT